MIKKLNLILPLLIVACSCSHKTLAPPPRTFVERPSSTQKIDPDTLSPSEKMAYLYLEGKSETDNIKACTIFKNLETNSFFPIRELIIFHIIGRCELSYTELSSMWSEINIPSWLEEHYYSLSYEKAKFIGAKIEQAKFAALLSDFKKIQNEKVDLLNEAIALNADIDQEKTIEYTNKLQSIAPRFISNPSKEEYFSVGQDFEKNGEFSKARTYYQLIIDDSSTSLEQKFKAYNRVRLSYKIDLDKETYLKKTRQMTAWLNSLRTKEKSAEVQNLWGETVVNLARIIWTNNNRKEAKKILSTIVHVNFNDQNLRATILWVLGAISLEEKKLQQSIDLNRKALRFDITDKALKEKLAWSLGHNLYLLKRYKQAATHFGAASQDKSLEGIQLKTSFWHGMSLKKLGERESANETFFEIIDQDPFSYYALISHIQTETPLSPIVIRNNPPRREDPLFDWLIALEEKAMAKSYLQDSKKMWPGNENILESLPLYLDAEYFDGLIPQFFSMDENFRTNIIQLYPQFAFPSPHKKEINSASQRFGIDPSLIFAIARQESMFDRYARSWADAFGLMQLLPSRASKLASAYHLPYQDKYSLYDIETNVLLGSSLLAELKKKMDQHFALYVGAYNAGEAPVKGWYSERFRNNWIEFIELIPYSETQKYIKLVLRNYYIYKRFNTNQPIHITNDIF